MNTRRARVSVPSFFWPIATIAVIASALATGGCSRNPALNSAPPAESRLLTSDGVSLAATIYPVKTERPPGLIFVHMMGTNRQSWAPLARRARQEGFMGVAIDLRGHGDSRSKGSETLDYRTFTDAAWAGVAQDIAAAKHELAVRGVDGANIAVVGAGLGANLALHYAVSDPEIAAVILLSPGIEEHGFNADHDIVALGRRPVLLMTSQDDSYAAGSCATLKRDAPGFCELRSYSGSATGTDLLASSPNAVEQAVQWLIPILKSSKAPVPEP